MIERQQAIAYYAPTRGRRYLTPAAAIKAEARAIINKHFPPEVPSPCGEHCGWCGDPGWSLEVDQPERYARYFAKLKRALRNRFNA
jgi:hypothetical protein